MDLLQAIGGNSTPGLAIGAGRGWRLAALVGQTESLGLANGFAAGRTGLSDLPKESPEYQPQVPAAVAGVFVLVLLGQEPTRDKGVKESFKLVEGRTDGGAQAVELGVKAAGQRGKIRSHVGQCVYCPS